jgi:PHD/YefM family antitoxin component YafN of YafNO toxin-antitoxin module
MKARTGKVRKPEIVLRDGRPAAVILDIEEYRKLLEQLEETEDLKELARMRRGRLKFRKLEDVLAECAPDV